MNIKRIIKSELLFESLEDRLKSAYVKWCKKTKSKRQQTLDNIYNADGYVEELDVYSSDFSDPYSKMYQKAEELYAKEDYEGILKMIADHQCRGVYIDREFKEWLSYRNLMKSSDIFQYKSEVELAGELRNAKEKSFTKKLKKASAGEDFDKIWENDDMLIVVPKSHVGACKFGQGTKWCTASKRNNYFDSYYKRGILYRVLQKNDNYKELFSNFEKVNKRYKYDIENLSKVSLNLIRKQNTMSMVDKVDNAFGGKETSEFLNSLPNEGYEAIKNYKNLNEQKIKRIIREEMDDMGWIQDVEPNFDDMNLRVGDMLRIPTVNEDGSTFSIVTIIDIGLRGNKPITYKIESGMGQLQQRNVVDNKVDFIKRIIKDKWRPLYGNRGYKLNESDEWEWINDIKSNQDIAQKIADETKIKNGRLYPPFFPLHHFPPSTFFSNPFVFSPSFFTEYCKEQYGLNKEESKDTWERYIEIIKDKVNNLNESDEQNIKRIIREEINDFDWVGDSPEEITLKWMNNNLLKCVVGNNEIKIISKEKPESQQLLSMLEKDHPGIDKESWYNVIGIFFEDPKLGEFVDCDDYIKEKRNKINFDDVKEFLMSKFSIEINEDNSLSLNVYQETDGFMNGNIHVTNIPITGVYSKSKNAQNQALKISNLLKTQFGVNLIDEVMDWISNITEEELQEWSERPQHITPLESNLRL